MATTNSNIAYYLVPNATETAESAHYLIRIVPSGVAHFDNVIEDVTNSINTTALRGKMVWEEAARVAIEHLRRGETVDLGGIRLRLHIPGSMPCEDTPFVADVNELVVLTSGDSTYADVFTGVVPRKLSASELTSAIRVSNIMDVTTEIFGYIHGTDQWVVLGNGLTLDGEGEYVKAYEKKSGTYKGTATVVSVSKGQRAYCKFDPQLASGEYSLEIATKGLIGESTPRIFRKNVTVEASEPTPIDQSSDGTVKIMTAKDGTQSETFTYGNTWTATGIGLYGSGSDRFHVLDCTLKTSSSATGILMTADCAQDGKTMTCTSMEGETPPAAGTYPEAVWEVNIQKGQGEEQVNETLEIPIKLVVG